MKRLRYPKFIYGVWARSKLDGTWQFWNAADTKTAAEAMRTMAHGINDAVSVVSYFKGARVTDHCSLHAHQEHGREAEELRAGIEKMIGRCVDGGHTHISAGQLQRLLDSVDARDSLAFREAKPQRRKRPETAKDGSQK